MNTLWEKAKYLPTSIMNYVKRQRIITLQLDLKELHLLSKRKMSSSYGSMLPQFAKNSDVISHFKELVSSVKSVCNEPEGVSFEHLTTLQSKIRKELKSAQYVKLGLIDKDEVKVSTLSPACVDADVLPLAACVSPCEVANASSLLRLS